MNMNFTNTELKTIVAVSHAKSEHLLMSVALFR